MAESSSVDALIETVKRYLHLRIEQVKFLGTEKLSIILAAMVFLMVTILLAVIAVCYFSVALLQLLQSCVGIVWAGVIMGVVMLLLIGLVYMMRRRWILDPIARFLSRVLLDDKDDNTENPQI
ncbi:MAG TPA: hypothetical protein H9982_02980 [Candidatus Barnesiella excrementipullorum]|uniref:Phage holin family protein n=1 Tax=Candidatus Barnesiella excrementipullorum TaxID=2838479 RepID=A0A9D1VQG4_9BACT|nr:hypothetical protein [Candidatus Barnesiella excrementipullorum]